MILVDAPAAHRCLVDRLANLGCACGAHRAVRLMEREATIVPGQTAMGDDAAALPLEIGDHVLITDIENAARRQHPPPMLHQTLVTPVVAAELAEVVGVILFRAEQL